jgi:hypothetical protein
LKYRLGHEIPSVFPGIVNSLSAKQEAWYRDKTLAEFSPRLPSGQIFRFNKRVTSLPLLLNGRITPFVLSGKYDFLLRYDDGSFGIIDTKLSSSLGKAGLYWPQLAAYRHILEFQAMSVKVQMAHWQSDLTRCTKRLFRPTVLLTSCFTKCSTASRREKHRL